MAFKIFLDANVLLDFMLKRDNYVDATLLMEKIIVGDFKAFITPSIVHIVSYWLIKIYGISTTKELILQLLADVSVIDIPHEVVLVALHSKMNDIEDALQYYTAIHHRLDYFISGDKQLKKDCIPTLPVLTLKTFLGEINAN
jgi:predicted nucleic acid-binding protein